MINITSCKLEYPNARIDVINKKIFKKFAASYNIMYNNMYNNS